MYYTPCMMYLVIDTSLLTNILLIDTGPLAKTHLEADAFFGDDKQAPPYFQVSFFSVPAQPSSANEFAKLANFNPKVLLLTLFIIQ